MKVKNRLSLDGNFETVNDFNESFLRTKVKVFAFGSNRNKSSINEAAFTKAKQSIFNIPLVAKYNEDKDDLEGHNVYLTKDKNNNLVLKHDTYPFGVVSSDANIEFEEVNEGTEEDPSYKTYVVVDNVYLWKRYEATQKIEEWINNGIVPKVSMEIGDVEGAFNSDGYFEISDFNFQAITALGTDVEPCFPMAQIESYSKQTFEESFYQMIQELKVSINQSSTQEDIDNIIKQDQEGGTLVDEKLELMQKYSLTEESLKELNINIEDFSVEELEVKFQEMQTTSTQEVVETEPVTEFALTNSQLRDELRAELKKEYSTDDWGWKSYSYWYVDSDDQMVYAEDTNDSYRLVGFKYTMSGDKVAVDFESKTRVKIAYQPMEDTSVEAPINFMSIERSQYEANKKVKEVESTFEKVETVEVQPNTEFEELKQQFSTLQSEVESLRQFKEAKLTQERKQAEDELFAKFSQLTEEDLSELKSKTSEYSIDELEIQLFALLGKKTAQFSAQPKKEKQQTVKIGLDVPEEKKVSAYGDLFDKYAQK